MALRPGASEPDFDLLAAYVRALANPVRLELLWRLRVPHAVADLRIRPRRSDALSPDRAVTRQTLDRHVERLAGIGAVQRGAGREGEWVTNVPQLFSIVEELRLLATIPAHPRLVPDATTLFPTAGPRAPPAGAKLLVLTGPREGAVVPLEGVGPWTLGRSRASTVPLDYDVHVSANHARLDRAADGFTLAATPEASNPVAVNLAPLPPGASRRLAHGDLLTLGRTEMVLHER